MPVLKLLFNLIWPDTCIGCDRLWTQLCTKCGQHITFWENTRIGTDKLHLYPGLRAIYSAVEYIDLSTKLVKIVKFSGYWQYTKIMAILTVLQCAKLIRKQKVDVLIPVPIHPRRRAERSFNQTEKFASHLSALLNIPVEMKTLERNVYRKKQSLQNKNQRHSLENDFSVQGTALKNKTICLVDDVFTTGATLSACARALEKAQPKKIIALTFARAR